MSERGRDPAIAAADPRSRVAPSVAAGRPLLSLRTGGPHTRIAGTALLQLLLAVAMTLSATVVDPFLASPSGPARAAVTGPPTGARPAADRPSPRAKRKHERRQDRRHERERSRQRHHQDRDRARHRARARQKTSDAAHLCGAQAAARSGPCTHGPDPAPPGYHVRQDVAPLAPAAAAAQAATIDCDGDGQSGFRVQLLYVHASDVPSRFADFHASIQAWAADADQIVQRSAAETGGQRGIRFVHDQQCLPMVNEVAVSPDGDGSFWTMIDELQRQGYNRTDRIYQAFVDANAYCGVGVVWNDDRGDGLINRHNIGPSYSRIDSGCWGGAIAAHELTHNLGGVQLSAPHTSGGFHCIDEYDVMCYDDGGANSGLEVDCQNPDDDTLLLDCNHDDYFSTDPAPGSYLASHWNAANNRFLIGAVVPQANSPPAPAASAPSTQTARASKRKKHGKRKNGGAAKHRSHDRTVIKATR